MSNKVYWVLLAGCILTVVSVMAVINGFLPAFIAPIVMALYGLYIIYMTR